MTAPSDPKALAEWLRGQLGSGLYAATTLRFSREAVLEIAASLDAAATRLAEVERERDEARTQLKEQQRVFHDNQWRQLQEAQHDLAAAREALAWAWPLAESEVHRRSHAGVPSAVGLERELAKHRAALSPATKEVK